MYPSNLNVPSILLMKCLLTSTLRRGLLVLNPVSFAESLMEFALIQGLAAVLVFFCCFEPTSYECFFTFSCFSALNVLTYDCLVWRSSLRSLKIQIAAL